MGWQEWGTASAVLIVLAMEARRRWYNRQQAQRERELARLRETR